jgi:hypothetical protein
VRPCPCARAGSEGVRAKLGLTERLSRPASSAVSPRPGRVRLLRRRGTRGRDPRAALSRVKLSTKRTQALLMAPNQLPAGPEWATQRIQRKADLGNTPKVFQPTGTAG